MRFDIFIIIAAAITLAFSIIGAIAIARRTLTAVAIVVGSAFAVIHLLFVAHLAHGIHAAYVLRSAQDNWINWYRLFAFDAPELLLIAQLPFGSANWRLDFWITTSILGVVGTIHQFMTGAGFICVIQSGYRKKQKDAANNALGRTPKRRRPSATLGEEKQ